METLLLPFSPRFIVLTICAVVTGLLLGLGIVDRKVFDLVLVPLLIFGGLTLLGNPAIDGRESAAFRVDLVEEEPVKLVVLVLRQWGKWVGHRWIECEA